MPLYHKWGVVFIQISKNASVSIHCTLQNRTDDMHSHQSYMAELSQNDPDLFMSYVSFAIVRNPYDRFVSIYEYRTIGEPDPGHVNFKKTLENLLYGGDREFDYVDLAYWPQYKFISIKNIILVDEILRFENLREDWLKFSSKLNTREEYLFKINSNLRYENVTPSKIGKRWQDYYNQETADMVYKIYKKDFDIFDYKKSF